MAARLSRLVPRQLPILFAIVLLAALPLRAHAQVWTEQGDAVPLPPGQFTFGNGALNEIDGSLNNHQDVDMYAIRVLSHASVSLVLCEPFSMNIYVFDENGHGVTGASSCHALDLSNLPQGAYLIAVANYDVQPWAQTGANVVPMWGGLGLAGDAPQTPANAGLTPIILWQGGTNSPTNDNYYITLQGCTYFGNGPVPASTSTWGHLKASYR